jgi:hypothetical protein
MAQNTRTSRVDRLEGASAPATSYARPLHLTLPPGYRRALRRALAARDARASNRIQAAALAAE